MAKETLTTTRFVVAFFAGAVLGYLIGASHSSLSSSKLNLSASFEENQGMINFIPKTREDDALLLYMKKVNKFHQNQYKFPLKISCHPSNPSGAENLPPRIVANESDLFPRRLWGKPSEDIRHIPKYLVAFTVGINQKHNIDANVKKFSDNFTILLFHYDGNVSEWDEFEWSKKAIHVNVLKQTKWWYAKRFLHPSIVQPYDYIFLWDEDLGAEHFNAEEYIRLVTKYGLEISQPGLDPRPGIAWEITKRRLHQEVHKTADEDGTGRCSDPGPPCTGFVEIMAPVFTRDAWRCVWHMIQNDLVHGWGLDLSFHRCVEPANEKIGVVDSQWIVHQSFRSLHQEKGVAHEDLNVSERGFVEWITFQTRMEMAEQSLLLKKGNYDPC